MKIYERHNQADAIDFIAYVIEKFPFRIQMIRNQTALMLLPSRRFAGVPLNACFGR